MTIRIGNGFDAHQIKKGDGMILGGVYIACEYSIIAHSDGDIISHSVCDALLGAASLGDIGKFFPNTDEFKNISGAEMIKIVLSELKSKNYEIINIDITYIGEIPNIKKHRSEILQNLANMLKIDSEKISCKATTTDKMGFMGKKEGISCLTNVLIEKPAK